MILCSEASVIGQSALLLLGLGEAKCPDRMGREGQSQPVTLGLEGRQYYGLSMKPAPWVHVLKSVPSHLGDVFDGYT